MAGHSTWRVTVPRITGRRAGGGPSTDFAVVVTHGEHRDEQPVSDLRVRPVLGDAGGGEDQPW